VSGLKAYFPPIIGRIYCVENKRNHKKYFGGAPNVLNKLSFMEAIQDERFRADYIKYKNSDFSFNQVECQQYDSSYHMMIRVDYFKYIYHSIAKGYNSAYCLPQSPNLFAPTLPTLTKQALERNLRLTINRELIMKHLGTVVPPKKSDGYIYRIKHKTNDQTYFGNTTEAVSLANTIAHHYDQALKGNIKQNKLLKALSSNDFDAFTYSIVQTKEWGSNVNLVRSTNLLIQQHQTIETGYNHSRKSGHSLDTGVV